MQLQTSIHINATAEKLYKVYANYQQWNQVFPKTIINARLVKKADRKLIIEVAHKKAGKVINLLTFLSPTEIKLEEFKPLYNAVFINDFQPASNGSLYQISASVKLKKPYNLLDPFIKGFVKHKVKKFVLIPMKIYCEHSISPHAV